MTLPEDSQFNLSDGLRICRILNGMWQVSGAHGPIDPEAAVSSMFDYLDAGFTTWDLADHYGLAEDSSTGSVADVEKASEDGNEGCLWLAVCLGRRQGTDYVPSLQPKLLRH